MNTLVHEERLFTHTTLTPVQSAGRPHETHSVH